MTVDEIMKSSPEEIQKWLNASTDAEKFEVINALLLKLEDCVKRLEKDM